MDIKPHLRTIQRLSFQMVHDEEDKNLSPKQMSYLCNINQICNMILTYLDQPFEITELSNEEN